MATDSSSEYGRTWVEWFTCVEGNEYFCKVDTDYIMDRFNLTNLHLEVPHYVRALDMILDQEPPKPMSKEQEAQVEQSARHLYGLIHARFIITGAGQAKMMEKHKEGEFGKCPRVLCNQNPLLPVGITDVPRQSTVKLYCSRCEDIYNPKSRKHSMIDGAYFGTSFPHMLLQCHQSLRPAVSEQRYVPRIFGFRINKIAELHRWQDEQREEQKRRLALVAAGNNC
ncbi:casein kinase 2 regulatory subunit [Coemansia javaensis]|uniref:Casein kinase II subunit beta n=1 Tax=Coemansia javaensis TaxID=2761396 RepID=A0A9W8HJR3_9FUNG|nr:casein kinase 2 regulatory subunit [Coemansia javaensis]